MKKIKKLISVLLTCILSFCMINNVHADGVGSIEVNGTTEGKTYEIYKIFDLTYSGTKVAYTIDSDWEAFFNGEGIEYIVSTNTGNLNQITIGSEIKYINITDDNIEEFTQKALTYATTLEQNDGSKVAEGESLTFTDLALGYYLVYPQGATDILDGNGSICSITSTLPNATVNIKANYPTIEKEVDDQNAEVGQLIMFTITGRVPDTTGYTSYTYQLKDTMSSGLQLDSTVADFTIEFIDETTEPDTITKITDVIPVYSDNSFILTFDMTNYQDYVGRTIKVTYKVGVTEEAVNSDTTKNSATLTYSNDPKDLTKTTTTPPVEVFVYSSEINVIKVDANDTEVKLAGASFVLQNTDGLYYQAVDTNKAVITNTISTEAIVDVNWVEKEEDATLLVTDENGIVTFEGIENGTYYLVEVDAPEGYNKLTGPVTVKVGYTDEEETNLGTVAVSHEEIVENNSGTELPRTGGIGTKLFIIIGSLLVIGSAVVLITNKRMSKEY